MFDRQNIIISILTIFSIENTRLWVLRNFFHTEKKRSLKSIQIYIWWLFIVGALLGYNYMLGSYGNIWEAGIINITLFFIYCSSIVSVIYFTQQRGNTYYKQLLIVSICLFGIAAYGSLFIPMNTIVAYVLISVYAEEYMKIHASSALAHRQWWRSYIGRDIIFFALLMGLWFSFIEHIAYLIHHISTQWQTLRGMHIARGLLTTAIHMVGSGIIAYSALKFHTKSNFYRQWTIIGIIIAVWLHMTYNLSIHFWRTILTIIIGISCYYILSYLLYQTNIIYEKKM